MFFLHVNFTIFIYSFFFAIISLLLFLQFSQNLLCLYILVPRNVNKFDGMLYNFEINIECKLYICLI